MRDAPYSYKGHDGVMDPRIAKAIHDIVRAVEDEGGHPDHHRAIIRRHRAEWPTLWSALDELREATHSPVD